MRRRRKIPHYELVFVWDNSIEEELERQWIIEHRARSKKQKKHVKEETKEANNDTPETKDSRVL